MSEKNKDEQHTEDCTYIKAYDAKVRLDNSIFKILNEVGLFYNTHKRKFNKGGDYSIKARREYVQNATFEGSDGIRTSMTYRFFRGIWQDVKGQHKSIQSNRKNYLLDKRDRKKHLKKSIKKSSDKYHNLIKSSQKIKNHNLEEDKKNQLKVLRYKYNKLQRTDNSIAALEDIKDYTICYGSKALMKKRHRLKTNEEIETWKEEWHRKRNGQFSINGEHEEKQGNQTCQAFYHSDSDTFSMKIRLPYELEAKYGKHVVIENIIIPSYFKQKLIDELTKHQIKSSNRESISYRFMQLKNNEYRIIITLKHDNHEIVTHSNKGVIGVDVNADHLAVVEIAKNGDILNHFNIPMVLDGKTANQRKDIIANSIKLLRLYALEKKKNVVVEKLNFKQKRQQLYKSSNKIYNKMLSSFSYKKIQDGLKLLEYEYGIKVKGVSPNHTSLLGCTVAAEKGLSGHQAAAWFIAKRFYNLKEKIKRVFKYKVKGALFIVLVPSRIQKKEDLSNFIRDIHKYVQGTLAKKKNNEFKSIVLPYSKSQWITAVSKQPI